MDFLKTTTYSPQVMHITIFLNANLKHNYTVNYPKNPMPLEVSLGKLLYLKEVFSKNL